MYSRLAQLLVADNAILAKTRHLNLGKSSEHLGIRLPIIRCRFLVEDDVDEHLLDLYDQGGTTP